MRVTLTKGSIIVFLSLILAFPMAFAKDKGKRQRNDRPPGWEEGEKKSWDSDAPPRQERAVDKLEKKSNQKNKARKAHEKYHKNQNDPEKAEMGKMGKQKSKKTTSNYKLP
jgi:hypothetical protein